MSASGSILRLASALTLALSVAPDAGAQERVRVLRLGGGEMVAFEDGGAPSAAEAGTSAPAEGVTVRTIEGQTLSGALVPAAPGRLGLSAPDFLEPLVLDPAELAELSFAAGEAGDAESAPWRLRLVSGEELRGRLLAIHPDAWTLDLAGLGVHELSPFLLESIETLEGGAVVYSGPMGLSGWTVRGGGEGQWAFDPHGLVCTGARAVLVRDLGLGEGRELALRLEWTGRPAFRLGIGQREREGFDGGGVTIEPWGSQLVAWTQQDERVEVQVLDPALVEDGELQVHVRTSQTAIELLEPSGKRLARFEVERLSGPCLALVNDDEEELTLRSLHVLRADAEAPRQVEGREILRYDPAAESLELLDGHVPLDQVGGIGFSARGAVEVAEPAKGELWLTYADGRRVLGELSRVRADGIELVTRWAPEPVLSSLAQLARVEFVGADDGFRRRRSSPSFLVASAGEIAGTLEAIGPEGEVLWAPTIAEGTAQIDRSGVERIVVNRQTAYFVSSRRFPHFLQLRSGESFRAEVLAIDDEVVRFRSPFGGERELALGGLKAIELDVRAMDDFRGVTEDEEDASDGVRSSGWGVAAPRVTDTSEPFDARSLRRALTLPRRDLRRPAEHLLLARTGDFMRTHVRAIANGFIDVPAPTGGGSRRIPAERVAAIVWLELEPTDDEAEADASDGTDAQAAGIARLVLDDRTRILARLVSLADGRLVADSEVLGRLALDLSQLHAIEFAPSLLAAGTAYEDWLLRPMPEPFPDGAPEAPPPRPAVGTVAPETTGVDLAGEPLALSDHLGEVVLLEFWGHW